MQIPQAAGSGISRRAVLQALSGAWAAFARTGNPSQKGLAWPAYTLDQRATMVFDGPKSEVVHDPDREERIMLRDRPSGSLLQ
jgi:para-nitrobenzyl esterase